MEGLTASNPKKGIARVSWKRYNKAANYQVQIANTHDFKKKGRKSKTIKKNKTVRHTFKKLKPGQYFIRVRSTVKGSKTASEWAVISFWC